MSGPWPVRELIDTGTVTVDYGPWRLDVDSRVLFLPVAGNDGFDHADGLAYYIDLERCLTSAQVLDWIFQVAAKSWADHGVLGGLISALDDILDPQANLCSFGQPKSLTEADIARLVAEIPW